MKMNFLGGIIAGALIGSAVTMIADPVSDRDRRRLYRNTHDVFKKMGTVIDTMMR